MSSRPTDGNYADALTDIPTTARRILDGPSRTTNQREWDQIFQPRSMSGVPEPGQRCSEPDERGQEHDASSTMTKRRQIQLRTPSAPNDGPLGPPRKIFTMIADIVIVFMNSAM